MASSRMGMRVYVLMIAFSCVATSYMIIGKMHPHIAIIRAMTLRDSPKIDIFGADCCGGTNLHGPTSTFISKDGCVTDADLADTNLVKIVQEETTDIDTNVLVWKCLGYSYDVEMNIWRNDECFPKWKAKFPEPPDVIGVTRKYDPETDKKVRNASMDLMRSIPRTFKGGIRNLQSVGFQGFKLKELTPNKTRRAQAVNWLLYYREKLYGKTIEELIAQREDEAKPPEDVAELPSEKHFQRLRLDDQTAN